MWRVGEPVPKIDGNVITFMADGAELDVILAAMRGLSGEQMAALRIVDGDALRAVALAAAYDDGLIDMIQALGAAVQSAKEKQIPPTWDYLEQFATEAAEITRTIVATRPFSQMAQEKPDGDPHEGRPNTGA
jgi:hypothetical protein